MAKDSKLNPAWESDPDPAKCLISSFKHMSSFLTKHACCPTEARVSLSSKTVAIELSIYQTKAFVGLMGDT